MFEFIYNFFAVVFGYIMNVFYILLDLVGLPYLWLCIILFAATTRLLFVPQKFKAERKAKLAPAINYDLKKLRDSYGSIKKDDKERLTQYKKDMKSIYKGYRVSSGVGCLAMLIQFPILVGLFRVIREPFRYVPQLSLLTDAEKTTVNNFFGLSLEELPQAFGAIGIFVPAVVLVSSLIKIIPLFINKNTKPQVTAIVMNSISAALLTWMSFCFPIAISLYWVVNDIANTIITKIIKRSLNKNAEIAAILDNTSHLIEMEKAMAEAQADENGVPSAVQEDGREQETENAV